MQPNNDNKLMGAEKRVEMVALKRRDFLKVAGLMASVVAYSYLIPAPGKNLSSFELIRDGQVVEFRKSDTGKLLESLDGGKTWKMVADFGPGCSVRDIHSNTKALWVQLEYQGFRFTIQSLDGRVWHSAG